MIHVHPKTTLRTCHESSLAALSRQDLIFAWATNLIGEFDVVRR